jgi:hypothetical protein
MNCGNKEDICTFFITQHTPQLTFLHVLMQAEILHVKSDVVRRESWFTRSPEPITSFELYKSNILPLLINLIILLVTFWRKPDDRGIIPAPNPSRSFLLEQSRIPFHSEGSCKEIPVPKGFPTFDFIGGCIPSHLRSSKRFFFEFSKIYDA